MHAMNEHTEHKNEIELVHVAEMHHRSGSQIYAHARKTFGLIYVLSGSAIYEFDGVPYPVKAGDLFCIPQKVPFSMRPIEKTTYNTRQFGLMISDPVLHERMMRLYSPLSTDTTLKSMLDYIFRFWNIPAQDNKTLVNAFLQTILAQFYVGALNYDNPVSAYVLTDGYSPATRKILWYTESCRYKRFSLEEMAQALGYNKHYLCSAFAKDTGLTILTYVHFIKIRQAMVHFFYWGTGVAEVCEILCFDSMSYFSTLFKSVVGISPGAFRKSCLALSADERTQINTGALLFTSGPMPMENLFTSMKQVTTSVTKNTL